MLVSIGSYDICDGSLTGGVAIGKARVTMDRVFDVVMPLHGLNPELFDRIARKGSFTFAVQRTHANAVAAEFFATNLDTTVPSTGTVKITPTDSVSYFYIPNGAIIAHQTRLKGATTTTQYTIAGGQPTDTPP